MSLVPGARLGPYEILAAIGSGGMGVVYRARDTKLNRDVAIKVLLPAVASDPERVARFSREAQVLASLNHPNIAQIYGFEEGVGNTPWFLVLELVEGPTLADLIAGTASGFGLPAPGQSRGRGALETGGQGPEPRARSQKPNGTGLPIAEALPIAHQIADALEAAHEQGIIHRDLKPANVKVRSDGTVKVLDFGLAKAFAVGAGATGEAGGAGREDLAGSPTLSMQATQAGIILGTAAYMSPEQARGATVDKRTDLWAFGVVLFEMLTGTRPFGGDTTSDTLASVLKTQPDWTRLPAETPAPIGKLLRRCLEKDRKRRFADAADARLEIEEAQSAATPDAASAAVQVAASPRQRRWFLGAVFAATALLAAVMTPFAVLHLREQPLAPDPVRFQIAPPENVTLPPTGGFAVSPDGRHIVFAATGTDRVTRLWLRALDSIEARPLPGTEDSTGTPPFWSPDSRSIAFNAVGKLKRVDVAGGPAQTLCDVSAPVLGGSWNRHGVLIFGLSPGSVMRVSAAGGVSAPLTKPDTSRQENTHAFPFFLPDGRHFLYSRYGGETNGVYVGSLDATPEEQSATRLVTTFFGTAYVPSAAAGQGQMLFRREGTLMAQHFDDRALALSGEPAPVAERLGSFIGIGFFSASATGVLAYRTGSEGQASQLTWLDRQGKVLGTIGDPGAFIPGLNLSPDGARAAIVRFNLSQVGTDVWLVDLASDRSSRFTFGPRAAMSPIWSPDGSRIVFESTRDGVGNLYQKPANGATDEEALIKSADEKIPTGWSRDGGFLLYTVADAKTKSDVWVVPMEGDRKSTPFLSTAFNEDQGQFSPDGRWVAHRSDESGRSEVYVRTFSPNASGGKTLVSKAGGSDPRWRRDGKELFYTAPDGTMMAVEVTAGTEFRVGMAKPLFKLGTIGTVAPAWDVSSDGNRFLVSRFTQQTSQTPFTVVLNWQAGLKK